ncbi:MAG TPA: universal stress protein [Candidatus Angelobacter sp.]|nr:universal stress protein [Candidatus Angelobacter sp.]
MASKLLIAIDSTGLSEIVPEYLLSQVHPEQTEILVLQVVEPLLYSAPPEMSPGYQPENAARRKEIQDRAKISLNLALDVFRNAGFKVSSRLVESEVPEGIIQVSSEWGADLIVVTSHARKGVAKFFHRSVAESIVHRAPCSVLVLKEEAAKAAA